MMKIRESNARINGDGTIYDFNHGPIEIIADDGNLFRLRLYDDGRLEISSGIAACEFGDRILSEKMSVQPIAANRFVVSRIEGKS